MSEPPVSEPPVLPPVLALADLDATQLRERAHRLAQPPVLPDDRWRKLDTALWLVPVAAYFAFPGHLVLGSQVMITSGLVRRRSLTTCSSALP